MDKPDALRLADAIDPFVRPYAPDHLTSKVVAAELRRLSAVEAQRDALLEALIRCRDRFFPADQPERDRDELWEPVNAAIKAVEEAPNGIAQR